MKNTMMVMMMGHLPEPHPAYLAFTNWKAQPDSGNIAIYPSTDLGNSIRILGNTVRQACPTATSTQPTRNDLNPPPPGLRDSHA